MSASGPLRRLKRFGWSLLPYSPLEALESRRQRGLSVTIGAENPDARLSDFTLVTSSYEAGSLKGVIGVMGPTRMPYDKIIGLVEHTSRLVEGLLE